MMRLAHRKHQLGQIEQRRRQIVEQPEEHRIAPAVADLHVRLPNDRVARIDVRILVHQLAELGQRQRIAFARRAVNDFGRFQLPRANEPAHCDRRADDIVARNQIDQRARVARKGAEQAFHIAGQKAEMTAVGVADPALNGMLVGAVHWARSVWDGWWQWYCEREVL